MQGLLQNQLEDNEKKIISYTETKLDHVETEDTAQLSKLREGTLLLVANPGFRSAVKVKKKRHLYIS